jgi:hypothetical protein
MVYNINMSMKHNKSNKGDNMIVVKSYETKKGVAIVPDKTFSKFCRDMGFLPHHKVGKTWYVMGTNQY